MENTINIKTKYIKLDSLLKFAGIAESGAHAKDIIKEGLVIVNGEVCTMRGKKVFDKDIVVLKQGNVTIKLFVKSESVV